MKSDTCRQKLKDKREVYRRSDVGKSCDLAFATEFHRQPVEPSMSSAKRKLVVVLSPILTVPS